MKKTFGALFILIFTLLLTACNSENVQNFEIILAVDTGDIDDKAFVQGAWEAIKEYGENNGLTYTYYKAKDESEESIISIIEMAVKSGAKVVVSPGYLSEYPVYAMQSKYPDVNFILLDAEPRGKDEEDAYIANNTTSILFKEDEAGFLAGYSIVMDGYRKLGFMGGMAVNSVANFGLGFIQGAEYAGELLGLSAGDISVEYLYLGNYESTPENVTLASSWYNGGTEIIFACAGGAGNSVMKAAEASDKKVVGVDVDQSVESETVVTSAMKNIKKSVYETIDSVYEGTFNAGNSTVFDSSTGNVLLPIDTSRFETFTKDEYTEIYEKVSQGEISLINRTTIQGPSELTTSIVVVNQY